MWMMKGSVGIDFANITGFFLLLKMMYVSSAFSTFKKRNYNSLITKGNVSTKKKLVSFKWALPTVVVSILNSF